MMKLAMGLTRLWVRLYTKGLPSDVRDARRAEIESDLWEQGEDGESNGYKPQDTGLQVFFRLLAGIPADLTWRLEHRLTGRGESVLERSRNVGSTVLQKGAIGLTLLVAALYVAGAVGFVVDQSTGNADWTAEAWEVVLFGVAPFAAAALVVVGLLIGKRSPWWGTGLLAGGTTVMALVWFWLFFILVPVAIIVITFAVLRARRFSRERDRTAAA